MHLAQNECREAEETTHNDVDYAARVAQKAELTNAAKAKLFEGPVFRMVVVHFGLEADA